MCDTRIVGLEELTGLIPQLQGREFGGFVKEGGHADIIEDPIPWPHVEYRDGIDRLVEDAIYGIEEKNSELGLNAYSDILEANGLEWSDESLRSADVSKLDAKCLLAMILSIVRADRFSDGILLSYLNDGIILKWVEKINELYLRM